MYESLIETVPGDPDPLVVALGLWGTVMGNPNSATTPVYRGRLDNGTVVATLRAQIYSLTSFGTTPGNTPLANSDGKIRPLPVYFANGAAGQGQYKGRAEFLHFNLQARDYPFTHEVATASPYLYAGAWMLNWKTGVTPGT
jgi:hypothetical protein